MPLPNSIPIPTIKLGKRKARSQMCEVFTDDGRWLDKEYPALYSYVEDEEAGMTYILDPENQFKAEDNTMHQLLTEKSAIPLCLRQANAYQDKDGVAKTNDLVTLGNDLFRLTSKQKMAEQFRAIQVNDAWNKFIWIVSIVCGSMVVIAGMRYLPEMVK